jgi:hypothetical protein
MFLVINLSFHMFRPMMAITKTRRTEHHTQDQTQYRRPTVKEHDHHWDSQQDFN